jgi:hypothetical protein
MGRCNDFLSLGIFPLLHVSDRWWWMVALALRLSSTPTPVKYCAAAVFKNLTQRCDLDALSLKKNTMMVMVDQHA